MLDIALEKFGSLIGKKFLDPACGSGIFLVGLFIRIAEEWKQANPKARNDRRGRELIELMKSSLFGADINPTACRITAFSLYLAYLDQLTPRDIQELQAKGRALPHLVSDSQDGSVKRVQRNIHGTDFFAKDHNIPTDIDLVIGNPPWGSIATDKTPAGQWCKENGKPIPDKQIAAAFSWKAADHVTDAGKVCFILPHGLLFNHSNTAVSYQKQWISQNKVERVFNLSDFRWFLFNRAVYPAIVVSYQKGKPTPDHRIGYWSPKADWTITQAEVITVSPTDRTPVSVKEVLHDLESEDAPQVWKQIFWGSSRDMRFLDRLSLYSRLRDHVRNTRETDDNKPWVMAEGFQPVGKSDDTNKAQYLKLPSKKFLEAKSSNIDLFVTPDDCVDLKKDSITAGCRQPPSMMQTRSPERCSYTLIGRGHDAYRYAF